MKKFFLMCFLALSPLQSQASDPSKVGNPAPVFKEPPLRAFSLEPNQLTQEGFKAFKIDWIKVTNLILDRNFIGKALHSFPSLPRLTYLSLNECHIDGVPPCLSFLPKLVSLSMIGSSRLKGQAIDSFLNHSFMGEVIGFNFRALPKIKHLFVAGNNLINIHFSGILSGAPGLTTLDLSSNIQKNPYLIITDEVKDRVGINASTLAYPIINSILENKRIHQQNKELVWIPLKKWDEELGPFLPLSDSCRETIEVLNLGNNHLTDRAVLQILSGNALPRLRELDLSMNDITGEGLEELVSQGVLKSVQILNLRGNLLTPEDLKIFIEHKEDLPNLRELSLGINQIGYDHNDYLKSHLQKAFPGIVNFEHGY